MVSSFRQLRIWLFSKKKKNDVCSRTRAFRAVLRSTSLSRRVNRTNTGERRRDGSTRRRNGFRGYRARGFVTEEKTINRTHQKRESRSAVQPSNGARCFRRRDAFENSPFSNVRVGDDIRSLGGMTAAAGRGGPGTWNVRRDHPRKRCGKWSRNRFYASGVGWK